jgi:pyruvate dehydrogenase E1 component alpha subunit
MLCEMHCRINGCVGSRGGSMHLIDKSVGMAGTSAIVGGAVPIATGAALAAKMKGEDRVVVVFIGDATTEEGVLAESLNFATLKKVPVIFFCENNFYSVQSPLATRQPPRDLRAWAEGHGLPALAVDGVNVLAVHDAVRAAVARARAGDGPSFIEAPVYRFRAHGGAGDDSKTGYRAEAERAWEAWIRSRCSAATCAAQAPRRQCHHRMEQEIAAEIAGPSSSRSPSPNPTEEDLVPPCLRRLSRFTCRGMKGSSIHWSTIARSERGRVVSYAARSTKR